MEVLMGKSSINGPFSMAMSNNQRVYYEPLDFGTALLSDQLAFFSPTSWPLGDSPCSMPTIQKSKHCAIVILVIICYNDSNYNMLRMVSTIVFNSFQML
jgi:hypothetical protein